MPWSRNPKPGSRNPNPPLSNPKLTGIEKFVKIETNSLSSISDLTLSSQWYKRKISYISLMYEVCENENNKDQNPGLNSNCELLKSILRSDRLFFSKLNANFSSFIIIGSGFEPYLVLGLMCHQKALK